MVVLVLCVSRALKGWASLMYKEIAFSNLEIYIFRPDFCSRRSEEPEKRVGSVGLVFFCVSLYCIIIHRSVHSHIASIYTDDVIN